MARFKKLPLNTHEGKLVYGDGIIDEIVYITVDEIPFVEFYSTSKDKMLNNSIKVSFEKDGVHVDVVIKIHYSQSVSETAFKVQESIRHTVEAMTEFHIANVNVIIRGIMFDEKTDDKPEEKTSTDNHQQES